MMLVTQLVWCPAAMNRPMVQPTATSTTAPGSRAGKNRRSSRMVLTPTSPIISAENRLVSRVLATSMASEITGLPAMRRTVPPLVVARAIRRADTAAVSALGTSIRSARSSTPIRAAPPPGATRRRSRGEPSTCALISSTAAWSRGSSSTRGPTVTMPGKPCTASVLVRLTASSTPSTRSAVLVSMSRRAICSTVQMSGASTAT